MSDFIHLHLHTTYSLLDGQCQIKPLVAKAKSLMAQEGRDDLRLRISVQPGGCSGLIYQLYFDERPLMEGDAVKAGQVIGSVGQSAACEAERGWKSRRCWEES